MAETRCRDCGFLCVRRVAGGAAIEADDAVRKGQLPAAVYPGGAMGSEQTERGACFEREPQFADDLTALGFRITIEKARDCESFTPWLEGLSPKEHREMLNAAELLQKQQDRLDEQRATDLRWQAEQREKDRAWQLKASIVNAVIAGGLGGLLGIVGGVVVQLLSR